MRMRLKRLMIGEEASVAQRLCSVDMGVRAVRRMGARDASAEWC